MSSSARGGLGVWRARRLSGDPQKDATTILDRHAVSLRTKAEDDAHHKFRREAEDLQERLSDAFAVPPSSTVKVYLCEAKFSFTVENATPALAKKLAEAITNVLSTEKA